MSISVMLTDDHVLFREGIRQLLEFDGTIEVIDEAGDGEECLKKLEYSKPQILLLDINMPKVNGIEVLEEIKRRNIDTKVLILTVHSEIEYLLKSVNIGVDGYILKKSKSVELKKAINIIVDGDSYIQPELLLELNKRSISKNSDREKIGLLTRREMEVLLQIANGMINKEIANFLNISERTVKNHISNIFRKINVSDRTQAAVFAIKNNLVKLF